MKRINITPRKNWKESVEKIGFTYHSLGNSYWTETSAYEFNMETILFIEKATNEIYKMSLEAVQHVIDNKLYDRLKIPSRVIPLIERSWNFEEPSIYGRFDFSYNPANKSLKLLEFNADTPTSLFEGSVVQWYWLQDYNSSYDQFNSIDEKLKDWFKVLKDYLKGDAKLHFSAISESIEDFTTVEYMRDCAQQAGLDTNYLNIEDIGWHLKDMKFLDQDKNPIHNIFKLYPWEWMINEEYGRNLLIDDNQSYWIEPAWKMILSNKGILPIMYELFPNSPYILKAFFDTPNDLTSYAKKPLLSREGANVQIMKEGKMIGNSTGEYGEEGYIYQELAELPNYDNNFPVIGSWIVGEEAAGMGIRESTNLITGNLSSFVPHYIKD
jgi:glutathionylspermidine synthase